MSPSPHSDIKKRPSERRFEPDEISNEYLAYGWSLNIPRTGSRIGSKVSASIQTSEQKIFVEREIVFTASIASRMAHFVHSFLGTIIPSRVGIYLFFSKDERVRDCPEILKDSWIGFIDTVTRADDVDVLLLIHEYYPDFDDKWLFGVPRSFFLKI
jgi:hypothetical protein